LIDICFFENGWQKAVGTPFLQIKKQAHRIGESANLAAEYELYALGQKAVIYRTIFMICCSHNIARDL
jgi:hypothetical protein